MAIWADLVAAEHETEEAMKGDKIGAKGVFGVFGIYDFGKVKGVDADIGIKGETNIGTAYCVTEFLIFVFWVNDEDFCADHHGAESF